MMSDLMKTKFEIFEEIDKTIIYGDKDEYEKLIFDKLLVLPSGLDVLEEMLKEELVEPSKETIRLWVDGRCEFHRGFLTYNETIDIIVSVFARFKQDNGLVNTEGMKKEHGVE